jgi:hypothetical protein
MNKLSIIGLKKGGLNLKEIIAIQKLSNGGIGRKSIEV